jgi:ankyrin repeat protein
MTTLLHQACRNRDLEAVRVLLERYRVDANILNEGRNVLSDLFCEGPIDHSTIKILATLFKEAPRLPCVNSGHLIPLNQVILKQCRHATDIMIHYGHENPYARGTKGVTPVHVACAKLDWNTL